MATFTIPRLTYLVPTSQQLAALKAAQTVTVKPAPVTAPVVTTVQPVSPLLPVLRLVPLPPSPYLPTITRQPVVVPALPAPVSPEPVRAPEPPPLTAHTFSTCADCGKEQVTDIETPAAPTATLPAPAPVATPAPTPSPATPTAEVKPQGGRGWLTAFAVLLLVVGGLALASAVRPRK